MYTPLQGMQPPATCGMQQPPVMHGMHQPMLYGAQVPPISMPGYEGIGAGGFVPPPPVQPMPTPDSQPAQEWSVPALTNEEAKEAFYNFASSNCCYSTGPAKDGVITNMEQFNTYRTQKEFPMTEDEHLCSLPSALVVIFVQYRLETFTESRKTEWASKPYEGQPVTNFTQNIPNLWEIPVKPPNMFTNTTKDVEVPNTASVKPCDKCSASGHCQCTKCHGSMNVQCSMCNGNGKAAEEQVCTKCNGTGKMMCPDCSGRGTIVCATCKGKQKLLMYIKLVVEWKNNIDDYVTEQSSGLEKNDFESVTGKKLFKDTKFMVYPLNGFPEPNLAQASERLVRDHHSKFSQTSRILQQQQSIELIPITKVLYRWQAKDYVYFVYGVELKVKAIDYPATCCCTII